MKINGCNIPTSRSKFTGEILIYLVNGAVVRGFALRKNEFVTSWEALEEMKKKAGVT